MEDLAGEYACSPYAIERRSAKEKWANDKELYRNKYTASVQQKTLAQNVDREVKIRDRHLQVCDLIIAHCFRILAVKGPDGSTVVKPDVPAGDVDKASSALQKAQVVAFKALGVKEDPQIQANFNINVLNQEQKIQVQRLQVPFLKALCGEATEEDLKQIQGMLGNGDRRDG